MNIAARIASDVSILDLNGRIAIGESSVALRDKIRELVKSGQKDILLNMGEVSRMDSSGIGELIDAYVHVKKLGGQLKLSNPTMALRERLAITKLLIILECYDNEATALQSFRK